MLSGVSFQLADAIRRKLEAYATFADAIRRKLEAYATFAKFLRNGNQSP